MRQRKKIPDYEGHRTSFFYNHYTDGNTDTTIRLLTFNIRLGFHAAQDPWNKDEMGGTDTHLEDVAAIIESFNPDIIALQEVPLNRMNTIHKDYIEKLARRLQMNIAFGSHG